MAESKKTRIAEQINELAKVNDLDVYSAWKDVCEDEGGDEVYDMDTFDEYFDDPWEATRAAFFGDFNPTHNFFWFDAYANLESADYLDETPIDCDILAERAIEKDEDYGSKVIRDILNEPDPVPDVA